MSVPTRHGVHDVAGATALTFAALRQQVQAASTSGVLELDFGRIAADLVGPLEELLGEVTLKLENLAVPVISDREIRISGIYRLPTINRRIRRDIKPSVALEARFSDDSGTIAYTLAFAPTDDILHAISGEVAAVVERLPVRFDALWFTLSSVALDQARFDIPGKELLDVVVAQGRSYFFRFESDLLEALALEQTVFTLLENADPLRFTTNLRASLEVPPLLDLRVNQLSFDGPKALTVGGHGTLAFFGASLTVDGTMGISTSGFSFSVPVQNLVELPFTKPFFRGYKLKNTVAHLEGTLSQYTVGLSGDFVINGSGHGGRYAVAYASGNTTPIPDLFELSADRLVLSDAFTIMSGATVTLPEFIDRLIVLERAYLYYATRPGMKTASGVPSRPGAMAHADVTVLGYRAYGEVESLPDDAVKAKLLLSPIALGDVIRISGSGGAVPRSYVGTKVKPDPIALSIDTATKSATADLEVELLDAAAIKCIGTLADESLDFTVVIDLPKPLDRLEFAAALRHEAVRLTAGFDLELSLSPSLPGIHFKLAKLASVHGDIRIEAGPTRASASVEATASLGPLRVSVTLPIDPRKLDDVVRHLQEAITKEVERQLADAAGWLTAVLAGLIAYANDEVLAAAREIGRYLEEYFGKTEREAAKVLKQAGYTAEQAVDILREGQELAIEEVVDTLKDAEAFAEREIVGALRKLSEFVNEPKFTARQLGDLLFVNGLAPARVAEEVLDVLKDTTDAVGAAADVLAQVRLPASEVADFLRRNGKGVNEAAKLLASVFKFLEQEALGGALSAGGYVVEQARRAADNVFREAAQAVTRAREELERAWRRYTPRIEIRIGFKL